MRSFKKLFITSPLPPAPHPHATHTHNARLALFSSAYGWSAELILNQEQEMWSGTLLGPKHCPHCQHTAVAHTGKPLGTFKGYLSWERVCVHFGETVAAWGGQTVCTTTRTLFFFMDEAQWIWNASAHLFPRSSEIRGKIQLLLSSLPRGNVAFFVIRT